MKLSDDYAPKYVFNPLNRLTKTETATLNNLKADYLKKLDELGVITAQDALRAVKEDDFSFSWVEEVPEDAGFDFGEFGAGENVASGDELVDRKRRATNDARPVFKEDEHPRGNGGLFVKKGEKGKSGGKEASEQAEVESKIRELDKIDFTKEATLPNFPKHILEKYDLADKPILLKGNIIDKNVAAHPDITPDDARIITGQALYKPEAVLKANPDKPAYHNFISRVRDDKNAIVLLELADNKDNYEIVNYHWIDNYGVEKKIKKAETGGQAPG